ncbi:ABC-2 type transport system ATP-binding protein [Asanoa ferruginea]|uniref:ABC-2 type transport system ATP-binding protein n=1 Tax=Asanoa ferruginea TaxID=53367 RepID=A0A3D9ZX26_9ACTN|nr:ABC transporter ATP-binding protein [Asanoa ferruginea]REG01748.1 ABC-2 type transport system ATP-binding protein [Asanoa ferruginea]GIF49219.1 ABC transporter [Asanoa ferruginea]
MTDDAVRVRGLRKSYRDTTAVDGLDLDIAHGEVRALLGPNGAGKTTTVEILEGHRSRDGGSVSVLGVDPARAGIAWRREIGIVLQETADAAELTVAETIRHVARYFPRPRSLDETLDLVGLAEKRDSRVRRLSGGQRRRLDVALGIVGRPRLLFLDEPTTGFDPVARRQFWSTVRGLDTTILLTTHYLDEAAALADRVTVIDAGRVLAEGDPATLGARDLATVTWRDGRERTADPAALVARLTAVYSGAVPGLEITRPSLEDVYLDLIGADR